MRINLNNRARVVLTDKGAQVWNDYMSALGIAKYFNVREEGDTLTETLWELMSIFGDKLFNGGPVLFENNELYLLSSSDFPLQQPQPKEDKP